MDINFHPSAQETANGNSDAFQQANLALVGLFVNVTDVEGVLPSMTIKLQQSPDGTNWYNVSGISISSIAATGSFSASPAALALLADYIRVCWYITGTDASFTFSADVVAHSTLS